MELKDPETPKYRVTWINKRICRCDASHFQASYDALNNFGKLGIKIVKKSYVREFAGNSLGKL